MRRFRLFTLALVLLGLTLVPPFARADPVVSVTKIGNPIWQPVDFHVFPARIGSLSNGFADLITLAGQLLPPPNHVFDPALGIGPGTPHAGPYTKEFTNGMAALGITDRAVLLSTEFTPPFGVVGTFMMVPNPGTMGRSPDSNNGPIIPDSLYPINFNGPLFRNGELYDAFSFTGSFPPPLSSLGYQAPNGSLVQGHSHTPFFFFENSDFAPSPSTPLTGRYVLDLTALDQTNQGYRIGITFDVVNAPEPATILLLSGGLMGLGAWRYRRRQRGLSPV